MIAPSELFIENLCSPLFNYYSWSQVFASFQPVFPTNILLRKSLDCIHASKTLPSSSSNMDHGIDEAELYELEMEARLAEEEEIMRDLEQSQNHADDEVEHWKKLL